MPARVYSERLLVGRSVGGTTQTLTVPSGRRVVVRFVSVATFSVAAPYVAVKVAGQSVVWISPTATESTRHYDVRAVAYAGESVEILTGGGDVAWHVSGFMFTDV